MKFLKQLFGRGCKHRFSWPRIGENGGYYQRCLRCGTAYEYDWELMRQTDRVVVAGIEPGSVVMVSPISQGLSPLK